MWCGTSEKTAEVEVVCNFRITCFFEFKSYENNTYLEGRRHHGQGYYA